jgi:PAS domain S-box-containing protein
VKATAKKIRGKADTAGIDALVKDVPSVPRPLEEVVSKLNSLLQAIPDVVYFKDAGGRNVIINKAFEEFAGRPASELLGRTDEELLPPDLAAKCRESDLLAFGSRDPVRFEEVSTGPGGVLHIFETVKSAIFDDAGNALGLVGVSRDITERKIWGERVAESEERFRSLFENATIGLYRTTPGGRIIMANPTLVRMLGYSMFEELSVLNLKENGFEPSFARLQFIKRIEEEGEIRGLESAWKRRDGSVIFVRESARVVRGVDGSVLFYEGTVEDVTERKLAEQAVQESECRFRAIFETARELIFLKDKDLRYTLINPAFEKIFGLPAGESARRTDEAIFGHAEAGRIAETDRRVLAGEVVEEERERTVGDKKIAFHTIKVPMRDESGAIVGICGIARDTTERRRMEEALRASVREKELLIKEVHHRVKNNMQIISSILNLQSGSVRDPAARECLAECQNRIRSMALVHEKLYRSGNLSRIDFAEYLRSLTAALFHSCRTDAAQVRLDFKASSVSLDVNTAIPCGLIANELIINALKHGFPAGRSGSLRVGLEDLGGGRYRMIVADDGVGFPEDLDLRMTNTLGLQLVTLLVDQIGGKIELDRAGGTAFTIAFGEQNSGETPRP